MLEVYSTNVEVAADSAIPFQNVALKKGCTAELSGTGTIQLNKCGVYMVSFDGTASAETNVELYKDGVTQMQAQATGEAVSFETLVQVDKNNCGCCCSSPVTLQVISDSAVTFTNANIVVTKVC